MAKTQTAPIDGYDFLTTGLIKRLEAEISASVANQELIVKEFGQVVRTRIHTNQGIICSNCGADIPKEDQELCSECSIGYAVLLFIGV